MVILVVRADVLVAENCKPLSQHVRISTKLQARSKRSKCFLQQSTVALKNDSNVTFEFDLQSGVNM